MNFLPCINNSWSQKNVMELSSYLHLCTEVTHCAHVLENTFIYQQYGQGGHSESSVWGTVLLTDSRKLFTYEVELESDASIETTGVLRREGDGCSLAWDVCLNLWILREDTPSDCGQAMERQATLWGQAEDRWRACPSPGLRHTAHTTFS